MKICVVGAGAIGGVLGAKLALAGEDVTFIARNRNLEAINAQGFKLILEDGIEQRATTVRAVQRYACLLYTSPSPRDRTRSRMPSSA